MSKNKSKIPFIYKKKAKKNINELENSKNCENSNKNGKILLIVESPAKCKKIEQFLGPNYKCIASYGHIRQLNSLKNIDIENNFSPSYSLIDEPFKRKQIQNLEKEIKMASEVIIASDADREGEMIAYSIIELFKLSNDTKRIIFNEITENAIMYSMENPVKLDMNLVNAAKARQILDLLVGFKISPLLWKFIAYNNKNPLSAGRCQSPALKLIYDRQKQIDENKENIIYNCFGYFTNLNIKFKLDYHYENEEKNLDFLESNIGFNHIYNCDEPKKIYKKSPEPLTTSRLQQYASNEFHISPKITMKICQELYENGFITYMRTDNKLYSNDFVNSVKNFIIKNYNEKYINPEINDLIIFNNNCENKDNEITNKNIKNTKNAKFSQEAHEAIRPTNILLTELPDKYDVKYKKMYKLIHNITLESCMCPAIYFQINPFITAPNKHFFKFTSEMVYELGWQIVESKYSKNHKEESNEFSYLRALNNGTILKYRKIKSEVNIKGNKGHYTEAKLVQLLEEKGIGRPSTFSSLVEKIQERGYVKKDDIVGKEIKCKDYELIEDEIFEIENVRQFGNEKNKLIIQPLGIIVMEFLNNNFSLIIDYNYTSDMENNLDKIAKGDLVWYELCKLCYDELNKLIKAINKKSKISYKIDDNHNYIIGKYGPVIKAIYKSEDGQEQIQFKSVKNYLDFNKLEKGEYKLEDILATNEITPITNELVDDTIDNSLNNSLNNYEDILDENLDDLKSYQGGETLCKSSQGGETLLNSQLYLGLYEDKKLYIKTGQYGFYATWGKEKKTLKYFENELLEKIKVEFNIGKLSLELIEEIKKYVKQNENNNILREISKYITLRIGPKGDYIYYKHPNMKKPKFYDIKNFNSETNEDYKICDLNILKSWIKEKYNIY